MRAATLWSLFTDVRRIAGGEAGGLRIVPLAGDREIAVGNYELPVQRALAEHISVGGVFYDIGANVGFFSLLAARLVGPEGRVYAFEPVVRNAAAIARSVGLNGFGNVEVFEKAVGSASGTADLTLAHHIGGAMLASVGAPPDPSGSVRVDVVALDSFVLQRSLRPPTLVKIDVEGAEIDVLCGMEATLRAHPATLILEIDDPSEAGLAEKTRALSAQLAGMGYGLTPLAPSYPDTGWQVAHFVAQPGR